MVGILVGLTGMGGGSLMTPLLILVLRVSPVVAVGTDLVQMTVTKAFGAWQHHRQGSVDYRLAFRLAVGSVPGALAGVGFLVLLKRRGVAVDAVVSQALGVALLLVAVLLLARMALGRWRLFGSGAGRAGLLPGEVSSAAGDSLRRGCAGWRHVGGRGRALCRRPLEHVPGDGHAAGGGHGRLPRPDADQCGGARSLGRGPRGLHTFSEHSHRLGSRGVGREPFDGLHPQPRAAGRGHRDVVCCRLANAVGPAEEEWCRSRCLRPTR